MRVGWRRITHRLRPFLVIFLVLAWATSVWFFVSNFVTPSGFAEKPAAVLSRPCVRKPPKRGENGMKRREKVLVFGAAGFLGFHVTTMLHVDHNVLAVDNFREAGTFQFDIRQARMNMLRELGISMLEGDVCNPELSITDVEDVDLAVIVTLQTRRPTYAAGSAANTETFDCLLSFLEWFGEFSPRGRVVYTTSADFMVETIPSCSVAKKLFDGGPSCVDEFASLLVSRCGILLPNVTVVELQTCELIGEWQNPDSRVFRLAELIAGNNNIFLHREDRMNELHLMNVNEAASAIISSLVAELDTGAHAFGVCPSKPIAALEVATLLGLNETFVHRTRDTPRYYVTHASSTSVHPGIEPARPLDKVDDIPAFADWFQREGRAFGKISRKCQQSSVLFSTYFSQVKDPQVMFYRPKDSEEFIKGWYDSVDEVGINAVVLHDGLSEEFVERLEKPLIHFHPVSFFNKFSPNDIRFMLYSDYLRELDCSFDFVMFTDLRDVTFGRNPLTFMENAAREYDFFVGSEYRHQRLEGGISGCLKLCYGTAARGDWTKHLQLNAGIFGGAYENMLFALGLLGDKFQSRIGKRSEKENCNMPDLNYMFRVLFAESGLKFFTGSPLHSGFKDKLIPPKGNFYVYHK